MTKVKEQPPANTEIVFKNVGLNYVVSRVANWLDIFIVCWLIDGKFILLCVCRFS